MTRAACHCSLFISSRNETYPVLLLGTASREAPHKALNYAPPACLRWLASFSGTFGAQDHAQSACAPEAELQERGPHLKRGWRARAAPAARALRRLAAQFSGPSRTFWIILAVALLLAVVGISAGGILGFSPSSAQAVRVMLQGEQDPPRNQTALVDASRSTVTYYITSRSNRSAVVLYDSQNGYVCYRPAEQHACYLRRMEPGDRESTQGTLSTAELRGELLLQQNNQTKYYREFLGILAGQQVDPSGLGEAVQALCEQTPIFWVRRAGGPGKQRLIYLCIDICFPSNICVSICFYYLPE
ncbi:BRICHOS domain-containing protein 5 isoform X3 [Anas platyrhynchos]|uniref:BRICHOS domain-containing protein 5 isoform X3 n=1 Tax=Anas platyrhynchos TaxID=8839 RepID=UPI003AF1EB3D